ncbi:MAG: pseudouridine synthase family protein [Vicinamibacterales bacterium]
MTAVPLAGVTGSELIALKPAGLACEVPRDPSAPSLMRRLAAAGHAGLRLVHRLDRPACGLVLLARSKEAAAFHSSEIQARRWRKLYVARVAARTAPAHLVGPHKAHLRTVGRTATVVRSGGRPALLDVLGVSPVPGRAGEHHVLVLLHTGRFHQIRAMLAHLGVPLAGDAPYGGGTEAPMYLEHVVLACRSHADGAWRVWRAAEHPDRDPWAPTLSDAVGAQAARFAASAPGDAPPAPEGAHADGG